MTDDLKEKEYALNNNGQQEYAVMYFRDPPPQEGTALILIEQPSSNRSCWCRRRYTLFGVFIACLTTLIVSMMVTGNSPFSHSSSATAKTTQATTPSGTSAPASPNGQPCVTDFNTVLGVPPEIGVPAFSNCAVDHYSGVQFSFTPPGGSIAVQTGTEWQALEYAARALLVLQNVVFPIVDTPAALQQVYQLQVYNSQSIVTFGFLLNDGITAASNYSMPMLGDVIIYPAQPGLPVGHVAVVVAVAGSQVFVAEQNWDNAIWPNYGYSRALTLHVVSGTGSASAGQHMYLLTDGSYSISGWKRVLAA